MIGIIGGFSVVAAGACLGFGLLVHIADKRGLTSVGGETPLVYFGLCGLFTIAAAIAFK